MIKYQLKCKSGFCLNEKDFDGWFQSIEAYEKQKLQRLINCPICGSDEVVKTLTTPNIKTNKKIAYGKLNSKENLGIEFKNVSFSYDGKRKILKNINIKIIAKQKVALVGPTGSGKTTIFRLLFKFYEDYSGEILINNQNLRNI